MLQGVEIVAARSSAESHVPLSTIPCPWVP